MGVPVKILTLLKGPEQVKKQRNQPSPLFLARHALARSDTEFQTTSTKSGPVNGLENNVPSFTQPRSESPHLTSILRIGLSILVKGKNGTCLKKKFGTTVFFFFVSERRFPDNYTLTFAVDSREKKKLSQKAISCHAPFFPNTNLKVHLSIIKVR